jgi:hypothetical protein
VIDVKTVAMVDSNGRGVSVGINIWGNMIILVCAVCSQGMDPLDANERAQYWASCFRSGSARIHAAMAKATIMRLAGTPSLPVVAPVPRQVRTHQSKTKYILVDHFHKPLRFS